MPTHEGIGVVDGLGSMLPKKTDGKIKQTPPYFKHEADVLASTGTASEP